MLPPRRLDPFPPVRGLFPKGCSMSDDDQLIEDLARDEAKELLSGAVEELNTAGIHVLRQLAYKMADERPDIRRDAKG